MIEWLANATEFTQTHLKFPQGLDPSPLQFTPTRGIKQGCPLSPILFAIFNDTLLRWIQIKSPENIVESHNMTALGFADDMGLISTGSPDNIINQVRILHEWATLTDQKVNTAKTKILTTDISSRWQITNPGDPDQAHFQKVSTFKYLGVQVHAVPGEQAQAITTTFMQEKCAKFTNRLLKLKYLPIDNLTKIAATKSAIESLIPYGIYATHPKSIPIKHLQTILNHALKGKTKHWHLSNPITQDERLGPNMPNLEQDYTYEVVTELHRLVNQNNFAGHLLRSYLNQLKQPHGTHGQSIPWIPQQLN
jgi:hypothetical protein